MAAATDRAGPRRPRKARSETLARIAWVLPWIAVVITIIVVGGGLFAAAMFAFACVGLFEFHRMTAGVQPFLTVACAAAGGLVAAAYFGTQFQMVIAFAAVFPACFAAAVLRPDRDGITLSIAVTVFAVAWIGIPFAHAVLLRELPGHGAALLLDVLVATFVCDTAAYAGGRMFGRHRLAPALSPNKTLEGLVFGVAGGTLGVLVRGPLPGLAARPRRAGDGVLRRAAGPGRRPVRVDAQARPPDQGLGDDLRAPRGAARPPRRGPVHDRRRVLPGDPVRLLGAAPPH